METKIVTIDEVHFKREKRGNNVKIRCRLDDGNQIDMICRDSSLTDVEVSQDGETCSIEVNIQLVKNKNGNYFILKKV